MKKQFLKSAFAMSFGTLLSRITGLFRDIFIAKYLGTNIYTDIFFIAFKIPNFFRKIFAEGSVNFSFIPIFSSGLQTYGKEKMIHFAKNILSVLLCSLLVLTIIIEIFMSNFIKIFAIGFRNNSENFTLMVNLARIMFPYLIFISIVSLFSGILNIFNRFFVVSICSVILNILIIITLYYFRNLPHKQIITLLSYSVFLAGLLQVLWIIVFTLREKIIIYPIKPKITNDVKLFFSNFTHSFLTSGIAQINSIADLIIASLIPNAVSLLHYADRINQFPLSLIGTTLGITTLPLLSKYSNKNDKESQEIKENSLFISCFLGIPAFFGLFSLANPIIKLFFEGGEFTSKNVIQVANLLKIYSFSLPFCIIIKIGQNMFYAIKDTKTPMLYSLYCLIINVILNLLFYKLFSLYGIAISTVLSELYLTYLLFDKIKKQEMFIFNEDFIIKIVKIFYASIIMSIIAAFTYKILIFINIIFIRLFLTIGISGSVFILLSFFLKIISKEDIKELLNNKTLNH